MSARYVSFLVFLLASGQAAYAETNALDKDSTKSGVSKGGADKVVTALLYSYLDFKFDSSVEGVFNRFQGHSNIYSIGADNFKINSTITAGLYLLRTDMHYNAQSLLIAGDSMVPSYQDMHGNTIFGHVRKSFGNKFALDVIGGYGQNKIFSQTWLLPGTANQDIGSATYHSNNEFISVSALYRKYWQKTSLKVYVGALYSQINSGSYSLAYQQSTPSVLIEPLTNKVTYIFENAELVYNLNNQISPFINGGLIQVADFYLSRPAISEPISGALPQLIMDKNAFKLGVGLNFQHKNLLLRFEEKYYNSAGTYTSYQTVAGLEYQFS